MANPHPIAKALKFLHANIADRQEVAVDVFRYPMLSPKRFGTQKQVATTSKVITLSDSQMALGL
jgi:hypothetical protein